MQFTIAQKKKKVYLGVNLTKYVQDCIWKTTNTDERNQRRLNGEAY